MRSISRARGRAVAFCVATTSVFALYGNAAHAATVTVINNCNQTIWPAVFLSNASQPNGGGWSMAPNTQTSFSMPDNANGRLWARKNCNTGTSPYQCATGSCGGSGAQCQGTTGTEGTSLFEFTLVPGGTDTWDVSYVDGYDFPIGVTWSGNGSACSGPTQLTPNPTCNGDIISSCPSTYQEIVNGTDVECESPCTASGNQNTQYCCSAPPYNEGPSQCAESSWPSTAQSYVNLVHSDCPGSYGYAYDDLTSTWGCPNGTNYTVTFCPNGVQPGGGGTTGGTTGGGTTGGTTGAPSNGLHTLTPACAPSERLDDNAGGTTNGNKIQIWQANGEAPQQWNFANVGGNNYNLAVNEGPYCLDGGAATAGTPVQLWSCNGSPDQSWTVNSVNGGYQLVSAQSGLCLDDTNYGVTNGTVVQSYNCSSGDSAQTWMLDYTTPTIANGVHTLTPQCATGSRLDDSAGGTTNGNPVQIWQAAGNANQQWNFANIGGTTFNMAVNLGPYCLDDMGGAQGTQVGVWSCNGGTNQSWTATYLSGGYMFTDGSGLCLDVSGAGNANGTPVQNYPCNYSNAQIWAVN